MKRKREAKSEGGDIAELGLKWASKRRPPATDEKGLSSLGYKFMSSRPSARKSRLSTPRGTNFHTNGNTHGFIRNTEQQLPEVDDEEDTEGDWISQLGAKYMTRKKLYAARSPLTDCSAHFSPREHELELDNELDNSWIADYGMEWMKRRCRTRKGQYKVQDDAWLCELGFQWMSKVRERERATEVWLSDLSSQYMSRRKRDLDRGIEELGLTAYKKFTQSTRGPTDGYESISPWETRRKLHYWDDSDFELNPKRSRNGNGLHFGVPELGRVDKHEKASQANEAGAVQVEDANPSNYAEQEAKLNDDVDSSSRLNDQVWESELRSRDDDEVDVSDEFQVLDFDPLADLEPAQYVDLDDNSSSSFS
ncbi:hypothetical protein KC19_9G038900 [Ceratodon purpureus]|uniref:Uncharacterized protein n=1 Tax=Ceratodon purpureus TaxID=3225 RepID=A0A8T0GTX4_CERPU|nr:hypothetical protein KC19_9G038900 [Ceratodon purpureus]